ncbi:sulfatase [Puniceicoccales bacterium CK1056]|uniref:Sulfatase n=2 Tax=Oceanipulchritudo coccoides TaxID=2706888 RepID=A0A6B2M1G9_9BACT|nr:sulfatase [Oceanipulchritudo coccoides]
MLIVLLLQTGILSADDQQPNIVMFVVDDMCDWIGPMGHAQAITPNMDRLADQGITFQDAHTPGIFCAPARSAIFTGRLASRTGCYRTQVYFQTRPELRPLQVQLQACGYATFGAGKLFHHPAGYVDLRGWDSFFLRDEKLKEKGWDLQTWTVDSPILPDPYPSSIFNHDRKPANKFFMEWGKILDENEELMADTLRTNWACDLVSKEHGKPFFVAVGLYTPHFPNYVPEKYFDLYDPETIEHPPYFEWDLEDLPPAIKRAKTARSAIHKRLEQLDAVEDAIHGYLASISYADAMLGRLLDAIASGPNADNTIVVLWSDHGYHHGEKFDWGKHTLWERTTNVPFMWMGPGIARGESIETTVSLIDIMPTLLDYSGATADAGADGISLREVLDDPGKAVERNVVVPGMQPGEYAIVSNDWRYIHYADGTEELYNLDRDPNEWFNMAGLEGLSVVMEELRKSAPVTWAEPGPERNRLRLITEGREFHWITKK